MQNYHDLISDIFKNGVKQYSARTKTHCRVVAGRQLSYDLTKGLPVLTTRRLPVKNIIGELIGFFRGYTNAADFRSVGCNFWDANANENTAWLNNPFRNGTDDLGEIYGKVWTENTTYKLVDRFHAARIAYLETRGWKQLGILDAFNTGFSSPELILMVLKLNQLEALVKGIITDPSDRRLMVTGVSPGLKDVQSLPPCHLTYKFIPEQETKKMHLVVDMRSTDVFLGLPANIMSSAIFLHVVCRLTGYKASTLTMQLANAHIYQPHNNQCKMLLTRKHRVLPSLHISDAVSEIKDINTVGDCFATITTDDIGIFNYNPDSKIEASMMV